MANVTLATCVCLSRCLRLISRDMVSYRLEMHAPFFESEILYWAEEPPGRLLALEVHGPSRGRGTTVPVSFF
jgi:hypothetical protein